MGGCNCHTGCQVGAYTHYIFRFAFRIPFQTNQGLEHNGIKITKKAC